MQGNDTAKILGFGLAGCGGLAWLSACCLSTFFSYHVFFDRGGGISDDEAAPGMLAAGLCAFLSFVGMIGGIVMVVLRNRAATAAAASPGAPLAPFPWHFVSGCGSLLVLVLSCLPFIGIYAAYDDYERHQRYAIEDSDDPIFGGLWERRMEEDQRNMGLSACCSVFALLLAAGGIGGSVVLYSRHAKASAPPS